MWPARSIRGNENVTLHFKLEKLALPVFGGYETILVSVQDEEYGTFLDTNVEFFQQSFSPPITNNNPNKQSRSIQTYREVSDREISEANLELMPGFRLSWYYTGMDFKPDPLLDFPLWKENHKYSKFNKDFIREANKMPSHV